VPEQPVIIEPPSSGPVTPGTDDGSDAARGPGNVQVTPDPDPLPNVYVYTDELPQLVRRVTPIYPDIAREAGVEGTVKLQLLIGLDGRVLKAIVQPKGSVPMLDQAAITAALASVFTPALVNNRPVKVWVTQDYRFKLR
jgi:protein TonB